MMISCFSIPSSFNQVPTHQEEAVKFRPFDDDDDDDDDDGGGGNSDDASPALFDRSGAGSITNIKNFVNIGKVSTVREKER